MSHQIGYAVLYIISVLRSLGIKVTGEPSVIAEPEGKATAGRTSYSAAKDGESFTVRVRLGSTAETATQALQALVINGTRLATAGFTRIDKKAGAVHTKRLTGGKFSDGEKASANAVLQSIASQNPDHAALFEAGRKALVMEATSKKEFTRKVVLVSTKTGKVVPVPKLSVQTKTYGKIGQEGPTGERAGNERLSAAVKDFGLRYESYDPAKHDAEDAPASAPKAVKAA